MFSLGELDCTLEQLDNCSLSLWFVLVSSMWEGSTKFVLFVKGMGLTGIGGLVSSTCWSSLSIGLCGMAQADVE